MKHFKSVILAACAVFVAAALTLPSAPVSAQSSAALGIAPKKNYLVEPGKSVQDKLTIRNLDNSQPLQLTLRVVDFTFTDDGGTPKLFMDPNAEQTTWSLRPFLTVPKTVTIPKGGSKSLDMSVAIPAKHGAGSYYSAIVYSTGAPDGGNVGLSASGVTLVFTQIPGKVNEDLKLEKFGTYREATQGKPADYTYFNFEEPQKIAYTLKNNGNVTEAPAGSITVKPLFGKEIAIDNVNPTGSLALIGQSRTYTACIKLKAQDVDFNGTKTPAKTCTSPGLWPGFYTASLDLFYGQNGNKTQEITSSTSFWYLPLWFIILVLVFLAVIAYLVWRAYNWVRTKLYGKSPRRKSSRRK
jgi:hypothetical protein